MIRMRWVLRVRRTSASANAAPRTPSQTVPSGIIRRQKKETRQCHFTGNIGPKPGRDAAKQQIAPALCPDLGFELGDSPGHLPRCHCLPDTPCVLISPSSRVRVLIYLPRYVTINALVLPGSELPVFPVRPKRSTDDAVDACL